jgi:hypothetical protein
MIKKALFAAVIVLSFSMFSCKKGEGEGGTSSIKGKVYVKDYNNTFTTINEEYYGPKEDVYIVYGDSEVYNDKMETHFDGSFEFKYLRKGTYTIYAYSEDSTLTTNALQEVIKVIEITDKKTEYDIGDIVIAK